MKIFKNILLRIPYVVLLVLPYAFALVFNMWLKAETKGDAWDEFMRIMVTFSLVGALVVIICLCCGYSSCSGAGGKEWQEV